MRTARSNTVRGLAILLLLASGCTHQRATAEPSMDQLNDGHAVAVGPPGSSFDNPLPACGARESYALVSEMTCEDGSQPLGGNLAAGQSARVGSMGAHQEGTGLADSHIVDLYSLPCSAGAREVFVCLYHCAEGQSPY